jgi:hypothetical protein
MMQHASRVPALLSSISSALNSAVLGMLPSILQRCCQLVAAPQSPAVTDLPCTATWLAFTSKQSPLRWHCCRFLLMRVQGRDVPKGISTAQALLALATQARAQGAFKLARYAYSKLQVWLAYGCMGSARARTAVRMWRMHDIHAWEWLQISSPASSAS